MKTETEPNPDAICAHCGQKYSKHIHEETRGEKRIYCFDDTNGDLWSDEPGWEEISTLLESQHPDLYKSLAEEWKRKNGHLPALPAPQPGVGGEAEWQPESTAPNDRLIEVQFDRSHTNQQSLRIPCRTDGGEWFCEVMNMRIPRSSTDTWREWPHQPTPPIALPVRVEARETALEQFERLRRECGENEWHSVACSMQERATELEEAAAVLSRELEESRAGRADFIKLLASTLGVETDRQDYIVMHIQSLRAELEEAKAEVAIQKEAYETAAADRKFTAELSEQQAEQINSLQQQLTALRAAPRSEGATVFKAVCDRLEWAIRWIEHPNPTQEIWHSPDEWLALAREQLAEAKALAPRSETEGRDKALREALDDIHEQAKVAIMRIDAKEENVPLRAILKLIQLDAAAALAHDEKGAGE